MPNYKEMIDTARNQDALLVNIFRMLHNQISATQLEFADIINVRVDEVVGLQTVPASFSLVIRNDVTEALLELRTRSFIAVDGSLISLTGPGFVAGQVLENSLQSEQPADGQAEAGYVPASDRFVSLSDNEQGAKVREAAGALAAALTEANSITGNPGDDDALKREGLAAKGLLSGDRIHASLLRVLASIAKRLKAIAVRVEAKLIEQAADRLLVLIVELMKSLNLPL